MTDTRPVPLWAGRSMALLGIVLVALNLRTAVAAISPIAAQIGADVPLGAVALGIIGMVPPIAFALSGIFGAYGARKVGLERLLAIAIVSMIAGHLLRAAATSYPVLLVGSVLALAGAGVGNVLLPPIVKRYFPDQIGLVTSLYVTVMSLGASVPALVSAPIADSGGWRLSLAVWSVLALGSLVPWVVVIVQHRREKAALESDVEPPHERLSGSIWRSPTAWTLAVVFGLPSFHAYAVFAWLPQLLVDSAGVSRINAGALLALFGIMGLPAALIVPVLVIRLHNVRGLMLAGLAAFVIGYLGLLLAPSTLTWLWVALVGAGPLLFPACLTLINLRSRSHEGSVVLSGFVQGIGYSIGALGPLLVGILHSVTGSWTAPLLLLLATVLACAVPAVLVGRRTFVEDELLPH
ncbi:MFS transporter [Lacisediminihabitans profunda]|uniref:MFS transporter n=1 Tax=Lacisediminihabitans profunda TaxID=2594790 RepID=A0A5C8UU11_9MICO|nr:MFS transporter [Lacisediminihabitans profunda]TXN31443.1 MFS transporter [Lacisediminihabitans profunda]